MMRSNNNMDLFNIEKTEYSPSSYQGIKAHMTELYNDSFKKYL